jgi:homoserine O-acetyltransferase
MGGMRVIEWAVDRPERVASAVVVASTAAASADQIAWARPQLVAIESDPAFHGGDYYGRTEQPEAGMGIARRIAHTTYRSAGELHDRFGRQPQDQDVDGAADAFYAVESYLDHHARKLSGRFDPNSYLALTRAMNSHDIGRGRGGLDAAFARVTADTLAIGVTSDRLYPVSQAEEIARSVPHGRLAVVTSPHGHDGFLIEIEAVGALIREHLATHR